MRKLKEPTGLVSVWKETGGTGTQPPALRWKTHGQLLPFPAEEKAKRKLRAPFS